MSSKEEESSDEIPESSSFPESRSFKRKFIEDLSNKKTLKLKCIYFLLLSGIVILWAQLTIHQSSLNLSDRDISEFTSVSSLLGIFTPFISGLIADKIGNFSRLTSILMMLMGVNAFFFIVIPPVKTMPSTCLEEDINIFTNISVAAFLEGKQESVDDQTQLNQFHDCLSNRSNLSEFHLRQEDVSIINCSQLLSLKVPNAEYVVNSTTKADCVEASVLHHESYLLTYWSYMGIRTLFILLTGASFTLFDSAVMVMEKECDVDYGLQRAWGTLAALTSSYLGGFLVDFYSEGKEVKDFTLMFIASGVSCLLAAFVMFFVNIQFKLPATNFSKDFLRDILSFEAIALLIIVILKGLFMGYAETFMYLFMLSLGASSSLIALTITVGASFEFLLQVLATPITATIGNVYVIAFGILCFAARFIGFSYCYDPRVIVGLEVLDSWASGLTATATNIYAATFASTSTMASVRGLIGALDGGIGKFLGAKIGIEIKDYFGDRKAWRVMAAWALASSILYALALTLYRTLVVNTKRKKVYSVTSSKIHLASTTSIATEVESR